LIFPLPGEKGKKSGCCRGKGRQDRAFPFRRARRDEKGEREKKVGRGTILSYLSHEYCGEERGERKAGIKREGSHREHEYLIIRDRRTGEKKKIQSNIWSCCVAGKEL